MANTYLTSAVHKSILTEEVLIALKLKAFGITYIYYQKAMHMDSNNHPECDLL